jgi:hypothetical protein
LLGWASCSLAQDLSLWEGSAGESLLLHLEERARWEVREEADFQESRDDRNNFVGNRLRLGLEFRVGDALKVVAEGQDSRHWGADQDPARISGRFDDLRQAYTEVNIPAGRGSLGLKLGRQELAYGEERLVGAFGWSNVGRTFDAAKVRFAGNGYWADAFLAGARRRPLLSDTPEQTLAGLYCGLLQNRTDLRVEAYFLEKRDGFLLSGERGGSGHSRIPTWGGRGLWRPLPGVAVTAEAAWQGGHKGPDSHRANAQSLRAVWTLPTTTAPAVGVEWNRASGDANPSDGRSGSFDNLFPTNHDKYGLMDYHNWSNLREWKLFLRMKATDRIEGAVEFHDFRLDSPRGPWTSAGGAVLGWDPTGRSGSRVGREVDLVFSGDLIGKQGVKWLLGISQYSPGPFARAVRGPDLSRLFYLQVAFRPFQVRGRP